MHPWNGRVSQLVARIRCDLVNPEPTATSSSDLSSSAGSAAALAGPLAGIRVLELANVLAGPLCGQILGDFGAEVIKIEHPDGGDSFRSHGVQVDGHGLWFKGLARNKSCVAAYLGAPKGADIVRRLAATADVVIENFRPGTLDRWGIGFDELSAINPGLIMASITGFGQSGPYRDRPGFGTLAEALSGFAMITGDPSTAPTLPSVGLADSITGIAAVAAVSMALFHRDRPGGSGRGQHVDLSLWASMLCAVGPGPTVFSATGQLQQRLGNRTAANAPRDTYQTSDGRWLAISTSTNSIAARVMALVGHPEVIDEPWFASADERGARGDLLNGWVAEWIADRTEAEVVAAFADADAAVAPIYDAADVVADPHVRATEMIVDVPDDDLGSVALQAPLWSMSDSPGAIRHPGRGLGADTDRVLRSEARLTDEQIRALRAAGVIA